MSHEDEDDDLEELKRQMAEMEQTAEDVADTTANETAVPGTVGGGEEASIFVSNLDHSVTPEDLQAHFRSCGTVNRITILCNKHTGKPKGHAYVEFVEPEAAQLALGFSETMLKGREIKVVMKRTNLPGFMLRGRGRGGFRGRGRGGFRGRGRGRGRGYAPY